jgi:hypothetical protein
MLKEKTLSTLTEGSNKLKDRVSKSKEKSFKKKDEQSHKSHKKEENTASKSYKSKELYKRLRKNKDGE